MINLFIISDIKLYREGLRDNLGQEDLFSVVGMASDVELAVDEIRKKQPDIIVQDMTMIASCEALGLIVSSCPDLKIVAFAVSEDEDTIVSCARHGIAGYVSRDSSIEQLIKVIHAVDKGEICCPRRIAANLIQKFKTSSDFEIRSPEKKTRHDCDSIISSLTTRERQIAELVFDGLSNKQIANCLTIEVSTVKNHVHKILNKMGVQSRTQIVSLLHQTMLSG